MLALKSISQSARNARSLHKLVTENSRSGIWSELVAINDKDGSIVTTDVLSASRLHECVDFIMNHFVKSEVTQITSGVSDNPEAVQECKEFLSLLLSQPTTHTHVYLAGRGAQRPDVVGFSTLMLVTERDAEVQFKSRTKEMKRYFEIYKRMSSLYPPTEIMKRLQTDRFYLDFGLAIHPQYRLQGFCYYECDLRRRVCRAHGVPATAAWCTMPGSQAVSAAAGWDTMFDISYDDMAQRLGIQFKKAGQGARCKVMAIKA